MRRLKHKSCALCLAKAARTGAHRGPPAYFDPGKVSNEEIKQLKSVLTVVGGRVVHNDLH